MRSRHALLLAPLLAAFLSSDAIGATDVPPLVVAVDVTLEAGDRAAAGSAVTELVGALPPDAEIGLVVFDDVVRSVVPLAPADVSQLEAVDAALTAEARDVDGNVAVGLERGLDELGDRDGSHLMLFARAQVSGEDEESRKRFADWYRELLLPDAAASGIAITLVSPAVDADATLLADIGAHPGNAIVPLATGPGTGTALVSALRGRLTGGDGDVVASSDPIDESATAAPGAVDREDVVAIPTAAPDAATNVTSGDAIAVAAETAVAPPDAVTAVRASPNDDASTLERLRPWLLAAAALLAGLLIVSTIRQRRAEHAHGTGTVPSDAPTVRTADAASVATAARVRASPSVTRARTDVAAREAAAARTVDRGPSPRVASSPARAETTLARARDGRAAEAPESPADLTADTPPARTADDPEVTSARADASEAASTGQPEPTAQRAPADLATANDPGRTARRDAADAPPTDDPAATARRESPDDATARRERPDDAGKVDELELLGRLTAERHRQGSLDD